jgi:lipopolysaccharide assembly outer membrane protein LptD (OstA)
LDLNLQKIFLLQKITVISDNFLLAADQAEFDLKTDQLLISGSSKTPVVANYKKNGTRVTIEAAQGTVDLKNGTVLFGTPAHLKTPDSRASADTISYLKKENTFKLSGRVQIEKNKNEYINCSEALWLPDKKSFKFKGRIKTKIKLEKNSAFKTFF